jgi:hypothetical protein
LSETEFKINSQQKSDLEPAIMYFPNDKAGEGNSGINSLPIGDG